MDKNEDKTLIVFLAMSPDLKDRLEKLSNTKEPGGLCNLIRKILSNYVVDAEIEGKI